MESKRTYVADCVTERQTTRWMKLRLRTIPNRPTRKIQTASKYGR
jgi:hypothetical protein